MANTAGSDADSLKLLERFGDAWNRHDLFTFRDGKIAIKNSYRKNRLPV